MSRRAATILIAALASSAACQAPPEAPAGATRGTIPRPELDGSEPEVVHAVREAQTAVEREPDSAAAWGILGDRYRAGGWLEAAAACYRESERLEPIEFLWPYLEGRSLITADPAAAADAFGRAIEIDTAYAPAHVLRAYCLVRINRGDDARREFETAVELDPANAHARVGLGQLALSAGEFETARERLEQALQLDPDSRDAHRSLSQVYMALGDEELALSHASRAQQLQHQKGMLDPRMEARTQVAGSIAHLDAAMKRMAEGDYRGAMDEFEETLRNNPDHSLAHFNLGRIHGRLGNHDEAVRHFREVLRVRPGASDACQLLGRELALGSRLEEATAAVRDCVTHVPDDAALRYLLGDLLSQGGDPQHAERELLEAVRLEPDDGELRLYLGTLLARQGRASEAAPHLAQAVRLRPGDADARVNLGLALTHVARVDEAVRHFRDAIRIDPNHARAHNGLAGCLQAQGRASEAVAAYREAVRLEPGWPEPARRLAWVYATHPNGQIRDASEAVRLAERAAGATRGRDPVALDTLAAAYAEAGRFTEAVLAARQALNRAGAARNHSLVEQIRARLELYELRRPYRQG